jgi:hypothetical protein
MDKDKVLLEKYKDQVAKFKTFCEGVTPQMDRTVFDNINFYDFSVGFFIALGVVDNSIYPDENEPFADACSLARICRYDFQYWQKG